MFWRSLCSKFFGLRDYFERFLCWLDHWLSCVLDCIHICVFHISKNSFEKLARHLLTPPRYLAIYRASQAFFLTQSRHLLNTWWIDRESSCLLDSSLTPGGSIKLLFLNLILCCLIASQYLSYRRPVPRHLPRQLPRYLPIPQLSSITRVYIFFHRDSSLISSISLDLSATIHLPNTLLFTPNLFHKDSSSFFSFYTLCKLLILSHSCISCFKT